MNAPAYFCVFCCANAYVKTGRLKPKRKCYKNISVLSFLIKNVYLFVFFDIVESAKAFALSPCFVVFHPEIFILCCPCRTITKTLGVPNGFSSCLLFEHFFLKHLPFFATELSLQSCAFVFLTLLQPYLLHNTEIKMFSKVFFQPNCTSFDGDQEQHP